MKILLAPEAQLLSRSPKKIQKNAKLVSSESETVGSITAILLDEKFNQPIRSCISCVVSPCLVARLVGWLTDWLVLMSVAVACLLLLAVVVVVVVFSAACYCFFFLLFASAFLVLLTTVFLLLITADFLLLLASDFLMLG